jgi:molybdate transport system substrate-binding protein
MTERNHVLKVYSAGAVAPPLQKAISAFEKEAGIKCDLTIGKPSVLLAEIESAKQGDLICCGAEYILDEATEAGTVKGELRRSLGLRRSALIVPKGNPAGIRSIRDLVRPGVRVGIATEGCLKGLWDDVASRAKLTDEVRRNISDRADSCGAVMALVNTKKVDAIFGWSAFANIWPETSEAVELPDELQVFRSTVAGVISYSKNEASALELLEFLASSAVDELYADLGWIRR